MRIRVVHATSYAYQTPTRSILQVLRLTPRDYDTQHVVSWRVEADEDVRLRVDEDAFGNTVHVLWTDRPLSALTLTVRGEVRTADAGGVVAGAVERLPLGIYRRETPLTRPDAALIDLADTIAAEAGPSPLERLHRLLTVLHQEVAFDTKATTVTVTAAEAFALRRGVCQDIAHIFLAAARRLGAPARYVSGHLVRQDGSVEQEAAHAWAEAHVPGLGWVGFDPTNGICPTDAYVRVAIGLDYLDAAPVRGTRQGGGEETMAVRLKVGETQQQ